MNFKQKAAMFGLDARIALAIFGALSVITGASLYSAIQQAKATQAITGLNELGKAVEAYYLDTGQWLPFYSTETRLTESRFLNVDSGVYGWKGPYINFAASSYALDHNLYNNAHVSFADKNSAACSAANACYIWVSVNGIPKEIAYQVDKSIDGVISNAGKVLIHDYPSIPGTATLVYKYGLKSK